jgi:hypothetical protein
MGGFIRIVLAIVLAVVIGGAAGLLAGACSDRGAPAEAAQAP